MKAVGCNLYIQSASHIEPSVLIEKSPVGGGDGCCEYLAGFQNTGRGWLNQCETAETLRTPCGGDSMKANLVLFRTSSS